MHVRARLGGTCMCVRGWGTCMCVCEVGGTCMCVCEVGGLTSEVSRIHYASILEKIRSCMSLSFSHIHRTHELKATDI